MDIVDMQANDIQHIAKSNTTDEDGSLADLLNSIPSHDTVLLTDREQDIVNLYDQLSDLRLEHALLQVQRDTGRSAICRVLPNVLAKVDSDQDAELPQETTESHLRAMERECLEARAAYLLKNSAIEDVLVVAPLLEAIHSNADTNSINRLLRPLVADRDIVSMAHTNLSTMYQSIMNTLSSTETESIVTLRMNQQLTTDLLGLTDQLKAQEPANIDDPELRHTLEELQKRSKEAKRRWRIMKSLVSAVIAGSGVDWAHDENLRDLVLDDED
ncbi:hypothetical protein MMC26_001825 [Xylographa opegraphella]|nr:hypothetical protein [Xylographa opegraphella]